MILPDSGDRYLSKFYSDDWLREKGLLDSGATARDLLARKTDPRARGGRPDDRGARRARSSSATTGSPPMPGAFGVPRTWAASRRRRSCAGASPTRRSSYRTVQAVLQPPFPEVSANAPVSELLHRLKEERDAPRARPRRPEPPVGVLTRHDLVGFLSEQGGAHAI